MLRTLNTFVTAGVRFTTSPNVSIGGDLNSSMPTTFSMNASGEPTTPTLMGSRDTGKPATSSTTSSR